VGTSYSANEKWNFLGALQQAFAQDFINVAADGKGPMTPMQDYLQSANFKSNPPQFIVWDIPERFLGVSYPAAQPK
jgi:alginate O-acetyltransferase complex protein AlgJ